jgi:hypothetical protein
MTHRAQRPTEAGKEEERSTEPDGARSAHPEERSQRMSEALSLTALPLGPIQQALPLGPTEHSRLTEGTRRAVLGQTGRSLEGGTELSGLGQTGPLRLTG